uniref:Uncharacterized protein n=1 Tax=Oryza rufipogon TaxID=4529 RepID=A0A0E0R3W8_ORYRU
MEVQVKRTLVVPPPPTCETEEVPLTVFDLVAPTYHVTVLFAFSPPNPTTRALLDALSAMLPHFPLLTARLERRGARRRPFFVTGRGGAGALVVEAEGKYTTFETVSAHVWKKITAVRGLDAGVRTSVNVSVNGRARLGTAAVPNGFFGNLIITASSGATARELTTGTLADAAALVRAGIRAVDRRYFQSFVDFGALHCDGDGDEDEPVEPVNVDEPGVLSPDVDSDSWLHLELHRLDLGLGGRLAGILPAKVPEDGVVVVMPSLRKGGGVEVFVALWEKHAKELTSIAYTLD